MGYGGWDRGTYDRTTRADRAAGRDTFDYGKTATKIHTLLDPKRVASERSPFAGKVMRECAISEEHPNPTPIVFGLDVTASNGPACYAAYNELPKMFETFQKCVADPQVMMAAIGDANPGRMGGSPDRFPLQVGDFESDNRVAEQVKAMILEMGGGGQDHENYELLAYFLVQHTVLQTFNVQQRKGYAFFVGDEMPYDTVKAKHVVNIIGDGTETDLSTEEVFKTLQEQYNTYFLFQAQGSHSEKQIMPTWRNLLGENALILDDPKNVCAVVAGIVAMGENNGDWDLVSANLRDSGFDPLAIEAQFEMPPRRM